MRYMLLIYGPESEDENMTEQEGQALMAAYGAFAQALEQSGAVRDGARLRPVADATTVRVRGGRTLTSDGPFAETKEQLGGYYLIDVPDLDAALEWAARVPSAASGSVEVRPLWEM